MKTTFYISDGWGYRVVQPGKAIEVFHHEHEHHQQDESHQHEEGEHDHHEHHGVITEWKDLYFPEICRHFDGTNDRPGTVLPPGGSMCIVKNLYKRYIEYKR